jgi:hypothetical protein
MVARAMVAVIAMSCVVISRTDRLCAGLLVYRASLVMLCCSRIDLDHERPPGKHPIM